MLDDVSFTYMRNRIGPSIVPWETPDLTEDNEVVPRTTTRCCRFVKEISKPLQQTALYSITSGGSRGEALGTCPPP